MDRGSGADPRALEIMMSVVGLSGAERENAIEAACAGDDALRRDVERLLAADDDRSGFLDTPAIVTGALPPDSDEPDRIGLFRVTSVIGRGGFGVVYRGEQTDPIKRTVALKVIKRGMDSNAVIARFEEERRTVALVDHPHIARILEGGLIPDGQRGAGRPYFAMEFVDGSEITEYAHTHRLGVAERIRLVRQACAAVQHAHTKGVIHRDLKPGNILVTEIDGEPASKVIDFGIAKALGGGADGATAMTSPGAMVGTPRYMSPEQARGDPDIDTRTDVYALGAVLYELLTGGTPIDATPGGDRGTEASRRPAEDTDPPAPSARRSGEGPADAGSAPGGNTGVDPREIRGDLDWITLKALSGNRDRRYETVAAFSEDLARFLANEPVVARPPSVSYRVTKFVRRNRAAVAAASLVLAALTVSLGVSLAALAAEADARRVAETSLARSEAAGGFLTDVLRGITPELTEGKDTALMRAALDRARANVGEISDASVRAEMLDLIGSTFEDIFEYEAALETLEAASSGYAETGRGASPRAFQTRLNIAATLEKLGRLDDADATRLQILADAGDRPDLLDARFEVRLALADLRNLQERGDEAYEFAEAARSLASEIGDRTGVARAEMVLGAACRRTDRPDEAEAFFLSALDGMRSVDPDLIEIGIALNSLGLLARQRGESDRAADYYLESIAHRDRLDPRPNPQLAGTLANLGRLLVSLERLDEAEAVLARSVAIHREVFQPGDFRISFPLASLADYRSRIGDHERALELFQESLELRRGTFPEDHVAVVASKIELGTALNNLERYEAAEALLAPLVEIADDPRLPAEDYAATIDHRLAVAVHGLGRHDEALLLIERALSVDGIQPAARDQWEELRGAVRQAIDAGTAP